MFAHLLPLYVDARLQLQGTGGLSPLHKVASPPRGRFPWEGPLCL